MTPNVPPLCGDLFCEGFNASSPAHGLDRYEMCFSGKRVVFGEVPTHHKNSGRYASVMCNRLWRAADIQSVADAIGMTLVHFEEKLLCTPPTRILVCALGNESITADSLGYRSADLIIPGKVGMREVTVIKAPPLTLTGIPSSEAAVLFTRHTSAELVICIDSLAAVTPERLGGVVQISDGGIRPGSGVSATNPAITKDVLGVPILTVGIPTVIRGERSMTYTVAEINELIRKGSAAIAGGINSYTSMNCTAE